ncbi:MAG: fibrillarin-like rRNA/tRNA 2'-O-methyltransferase [Nitrososphaerales archaeon]|nr:fibrillarin-like rRNA/tRNA 2'-O-methyltransferase [Nitrososphaerales archaeon]
MIKKEGNQRLRKVRLEGKNKLVTLNLVPGTNVYGEAILKLDGEDYRIWDPFRSKLSAALLNGLNNFPIIEGSRMLYLGTSTGTTASHVSDIIGEDGIIFAVENAPRVAREFIERVALKRKNVIPIVEDARKPNSYTAIFTKVNIVYCDIAQRDQTEIAIMNCKRHLIKGGNILLIVKSRSIDANIDPERIFQQEISKVEKEGFKIQQVIKLDPFDKDHVMINAIF